MLIKTPRFIRKFVKTTHFWQDNALVLREFKHFKKIAILALVFTLLTAIFEGFGVGFLLTFLQSLTEPNAEPIKTGIEWFDIMILGVNTSSTERVYRISALILIVTLLRAIFTYLSRFYSGLSQGNLVYQIRWRVFEQLQAVRLSYFSKTRSGELVNTITTETEQLTRAVETFSLILVKSLTLLVYFISMFLLSWQLTLISLLSFSLLSAGISNLVKRVREVSFERSKANGAYTTTVVEFINGIRTIQSFAALDFEHQRFDKVNQNVLKAYVKGAKFKALIEPITESLSTGILVIILVICTSILIPSGKMQIASLLTFLFVLFRILPIVRQLNGARGTLSNFVGSIENIKSLLNSTDKPYQSNGYRQFLGLQQQIEFKNVDFSYEPEELILSHINLTIQRNQVVALVGASGAGKTTLADLVPRLHDPTQGLVLIDGVDLQEFEINSVRRKMAIVSQDTFIFNASVRDNIAYGLKNVSDQVVIEAAQQAHALEFIQKLPEGLETKLGDRGVRLSGGQRQRIAIARALLRNPEILILDEATSALDSVTEKLIQDSLEKLAHGRTVIIIAHRLSTISKADQVVVLEKGKILEKGTYKELLLQEGKLWNYHQLQYKLE